MIQVHMYVRHGDIKHCDPAWAVFSEFFTAGPPARTTTTTDFLYTECLAQLDAIAVARKA